MPYKTFKITYRTLRREKTGYYYNKTKLEAINDLLKASEEIGDSVVLIYKIETVKARKEGEKTNEN